MINILDNSTNKNHRWRLSHLISGSDKIILCSGWMKYAGLKKLLKDIERSALNLDKEIIVYSNKSHTEKKCVEALSVLKNVKHVVVDDAIKKYLHSKIYYFESGAEFTAIIGSANITVGGLVKNEEVSIEISGQVGDEEYNKIMPYLSTL